MSLDPLLAAPWHIQLHAFSALACLILGAYQFLAPKGTVPHRFVGPVWVALMVIVVLTALFIVRPRAMGAPFSAHFSFIHYILVPITAFSLLQGVHYLRKKGAEKKRHGKAFAGLFIGGILIAGFFTFMPGRIMHDVMFDKRMSENPCLYPTAYLYFLPDTMPGAKAPPPGPKGKACKDKIYGDQELKQ